MRWLFLGAALAAVLLASACDDTAELSQVTVRVYVEPQVVDAMRTVRFRLSSQEGQQWVERELITVPKGRIDVYPIDVPVTPRDADPDRVFEVVVEALDGSDVALVQARAISGFVAGEVRVLELWLEVCGDMPLRQLCESDPGCYGTACAVCVGDECRDETAFTDPDDLRRLDPSKPPDPRKPNPDGLRERDMDGGTDGGLPDAGQDAGQDAEAGGPDATPDADAAPPLPCEADPCQNGGTCSNLSATEFSCKCLTGFLGDTCEETCDVTPAYPSAPEGGDGASNLVADAILYMTSQLDDGSISTCGAACASRYAADGERCGESARVPVAQLAHVDAGESWRADWSARGARRIDRIEIYAVAGNAATLDGAEIRVDDMPVGVYPDDTMAHALVFDPPLYGHSVQVVQTTGTLAMGLAEVEVWGQDGDPVVDVAFHGAARQSSVFAPNEAAVNAGASADAGPFRAVDGRSDTVAVTKAFARAGSLAIDDLVGGNGYPYRTGNQDEPPTVGNGNAWWYLDLERPQRLRAVHIHRGPNPQRLNGALVYLELNGTLEASPRWTLPAATADMDRLQAPEPVAAVTGVKIVSAVPSRSASKANPDASLELREVRVWASEPEAGNEPLRDLSVSASAEWDIADGDGSWRSPAQMNGWLDGNPSITGLSRRRRDTWARVRFPAASDVRYVDVYKHPSYPGTFLFSPGGGCPSRPLCGDTYGTCTYRMLDADMFVIDGDDAHVGEAVHNFGVEYIDHIELDLTAIAGLELTKANPTATVTAQCPGGYGTETQINTADIRVHGYSSLAAPLINYAELRFGAGATLEPADADGTYEAARAIDGWEGDFARSAGGGAQVLTIQLRRPVVAEEIRVVSVPGGVNGATLEVRVDGGVWQELAGLADRREQSVSLPADTLITGVRIRRSDTALVVHELEVLGAARY